jgi:predicted dehydrogenase
MPNVTRRQFLGSSVAAAATVAISHTKSSGRILGANDTVRVAVAGLNGRGGSHVSEFSKMTGVEVAYLVDPDTRTYRKRLDQLARAGRPEAKCVQDIRKVLENKDVDAVSVATPNHWHSLMTIWACQAGKDVYVEKPCSHNVHEGRIAVETARKHGRIVQHGTQSRSSSTWETLNAVAKSGKLGKLLVSRALCYKPGGGWETRGNIGVKEQKAPPSELDFNVWLGPAQEQPYHENLVHYRWHWFWDFGNGDIGNQGVHEMDKARWVIPGATWPKTVISLGGRFTGPDQGQTPNGLVTVMDYGDTLLIFEVRGQKSKPYYGQNGASNILHFEAGVVAGNKFYPKGSDKAEEMPKLGVEPARRPHGDHFGNFIACVRSRKVEELNADIAVGHVSAGLCHLANISYRLGKDEPFSAKSRVVSGNAFATDALGRMEEYLRENGVKLEGTSMHVGRKLDFDGQAEQFRNDPEANKLLTRAYRAPFTVPEKV